MPHATNSASFLKDFSPSGVLLPFATHRGSEAFRYGASCRGFDFMILSASRLRPEGGARRPHFGLPTTKQPCRIRQILCENCHVSQVAWRVGRPSPGFAL